MEGLEARRLSGLRGLARREIRRVDLHQRGACRRDIRFLLTRQWSDPMAAGDMVRWFDDIRLQDVPEVGGKTASLGELRVLLGDGGPPDGLKAGPRMTASDGG